MSFFEPDTVPAFSRGRICSELMGHPPSGAVEISLYLSMEWMGGQPLTLIKTVGVYSG
ncbi:MAG: hypothetical protein GY731_16210 [Gammaproteobacteria bacterium]|nr:hypothetical protein [Gammaproteobacteria bacterium]